MSMFYQIHRVLVVKSRWETTRVDYQNSMNCIDHTHEAWNILLIPTPAMKAVVILFFGLLKTFIV